MADFDLGYEICSCRQVTLGEVIHSIEEQKATDIKTIGKLTDAGTHCGCCRDKKSDFSEPKKKLHLEKIVEKFVKNG